MLKGRTIFISLAVAALLVAGGCGGSGNTGRNSGLRPFPYVTAPTSMSYDDAVVYEASHYWDLLADTTGRYICDSTHISGVAISSVREQFAQYITQMLPQDLNDARESVREVYKAIARCELKDSTSTVFDSLVSWMDYYLYDPNSPYRSEDVFGAFAACLSEFEGYSPEKRSYYAYQARMCSLNETGTPAADFDFRTADGRTYSLYDIRAEYTLLFFSNPGCPACREIITTLSEQLNVSEMIAAGKLAVLNIYIDEDLKSWFEYMPVYPKDWYNGYDPEGVIRSDVLYNVRAIPSLYLLDSDKTVLEKDAPENLIYMELSYLKGN